MARKRADFKVKSMVSRMNSGGSKSFNVDIHVVAATFIHARAFVHFIQWEGVFVIVLHITSLSTNEIGRYLTY